jgi:hypothetical protein
MLAYVLTLALGNHEVENHPVANHLAKRDIAAAIVKL